VAHQECLLVKSSVPLEGNDGEIKEKVLRNDKNTTGSLALSWRSLLTCESLGGLPGVSNHHITTQMEIRFLYLRDN